MIVVEFVNIQIELCVDEAFKLEISQERKITVGAEEETVSIEWSGRSIQWPFNGRSRPRRGSQRAERENLLKKPQNESKACSWPRGQPQRFRPSCHLNAVERFPKKKRSISLKTKGNLKTLKAHQMFADKNHHFGVPRCGGELLHLNKSPTE